MVKRADLPKSVKLYVQKCGGVIVGGCADPNQSIDQISDIDVLIPFSQWGAAAAIASYQQNVGRNSYGGLRYAEQNEKGFAISIDVWPQELALFLGNGNNKFMWFPQHNYRWSRDVVLGTQAGPVSRILAALERANLKRKCGANDTFEMGSGQDSRVYGRDR